MTRRLLASYLTITAFALVVLIVPLGRVFAERERERLVVDIERDATAVASLVEDALEEDRPVAIDPLLSAYAADGGRIVVVDRRGISVADSDRIGGAPRDFSTRPEVRSALAFERASGTRFSETLGVPLVYVAVPSSSGGVMHGAVRVSYPTSALDARTRENWLRLGALAATVLAAVGVVGFVLARGVTSPVRRLEAVSGRLAAGDLTARVATDHGAPELRALGATFNATADRLEQLIDAQRRFVADASHQLRTPLTALRLRLETLEPWVPDAQRPKLGAAVAETERLGRLVDSLLVLARSAAQRECTVVDAAAVLAERADTWAPVAHERDVGLVVRGARSACARAVAGALEQILDNLVSNALDVSPPGSTITLCASEAGDEVELHVVDEGPGMPEEHRRRAFERFWRPAGASTKGFGLGLAVVKELAVACGGDVALEPGAGGAGLDAAVRLRAAGRPAPAPAALPAGRAPARR